MTIVVKHFRLSCRDRLCLSGVSLPSSRCPGSNSNMHSYPSPTTIHDPRSRRVSRKSQRSVLVVDLSQRISCGLVSNIPTHGTHRETKRNETGRLNCNSLVGFQTIPMAQTVALCGPCACGPVPRRPLKKKGLRAAQWTERTGRVATGRQVARSLWVRSPSRGVPTTPGVSRPTRGLDWSVQFYVSSSSFVRSDYDQRRWIKKHALGLYPVARDLRALRFSVQNLAESESRQSSRVSAHRNCSKRRAQG